MLHFHVGIDNGVSGSVSAVSSKRSKYSFEPTPIRNEYDYTKKKKKINRVDVVALTNLLKAILDKGTIIRVVIERPMVNPRRFAATASALRCLEATLIVLEGFELPYQFIDSKEWQKALLPSGVEGPELKKASLSIGSRLFPKVKQAIQRHKDADGLLIAEYSRLHL